MHAGSIRFDTGLFVPMLFYEPDTITAVSIPLHLWIQASNTLWFGPMFGWRHWSNGWGTQYPFLGLRQRGADRLVPQQRGAHVPHQRLAMRALRESWRPES